MVPFTTIFIRTSPWVVSHQRFLMVITDTKYETYTRHTMNAVDL